MIGVRLEPVDTLFFRDGTPFEAKSTPQEDVGGPFPPHPTTTAGAIRAALARCNGWDGLGQWCNQLKEVLGNGPHDFGKLKLIGPFLLRHGEPLFKVPRHLLGVNGTDGWEPGVLLAPGPEVACDLGDRVRLPDAPPTKRERRLESGGMHWLTHVGMSSVLVGNVPAKDEIVLSDELWSDELRVGLKRCSDTRVAADGYLYSTRHVRLAEGVSLGLLVDADVPREWAWPFGDMIPLGGESRLVECHRWNGNVSFKAPFDKIAESGRIALIALSPLDIARDVNCCDMILSEFGNARIVSACLGHPYRIGGWDSLEHRPLPLRSVLPQGSVLFCELPESASLEQLVDKDTGLARLGARQTCGFGLVSVGSWPLRTEQASWIRR